MSLLFFYIFFFFKAPATTDIYTYVHSLSLHDALPTFAVAAVLVRHYFNTRHDSNKYAWTLPVGALAMICLAYVTGPKPMATAPEVAKAHGVIEYQPLPETPVGGGAQPPTAAPDPASTPTHAHTTPAQATPSPKFTSTDKEPLTIST